MPRLAPRLLHAARHTHPLLPLVLIATRDLQTARNEFRWLKEHAIQSIQRRSTGPDRPGWRHELRRLCEQRSRGKPLQYLVGSEYFGDLEILCEPGVLIPRQETATSVMHLVKCLNRSALPRELRLLDLCTGTGCIPLLFQHELYYQSPAEDVRLRSLAVDISHKAVSLARKNVNRQLFEQHSTGISEFASVEFIRADVLARDSKDEGCATPLMNALKERQQTTFDILISNPPYISPQAFRSTTARSVRNFEPKLALVPDARHMTPEVDLGDVFYPRLLEIAAEVDAKIVLFEVADLDQARRVSQMVLDKRRWNGVEIWKDQPTLEDDHDHALCSDEVNSNVKVRGHGNGRSVFAWTADAEAWLYSARTRYCT